MVTVPMAVFTTVPTAAPTVMGDPITPTVHCTTSLSHFDLSLQATAPTARLPTAPTARLPISPYRVLTPHILMELRALSDPTA